MVRPFEVSSDYLRSHLDEMAETVFSDLQSQFLVLPRGPNFIAYPTFQVAYEVLKRHTGAFSQLSEANVMAAFQENALSFVVLRTILGMTPPEWADLARAERESDVSQGYARSLEGHCRSDPAHFARLKLARHSKAVSRIQAMVSVALQYINRGAPSGAADTVHRLDKVDTAHGLDSLQYIAAQHVPYAVLLYERYLGRPFASHRDAVSELVGEVMENAIEQRLTRARVSFRKTRRAERIPGFPQAPDFFVPDEFNPAVIIEAKITGDDGTARDKVARIERLVTMRDERLRSGHAGFEVVACIDGRGFGVRREDMKSLLLKTEGKVFTLASLDALIPHTQLQQFVPTMPRGD